MLVRPHQYVSRTAFSIKQNPWYVSTTTFSILLSMLVLQYKCIFHQKILLGTIVRQYKHIFHQQFHHRFCKIINQSPSRNFSLTQILTIYFPRLTLSKICKLNLNINYQNSVATVNCFGRDLFTRSIYYQSMNRKKSHLCRVPRVSVIETEEKRTRSLTKDIYLT